MSSIPLLKSQEDLDRFIAENEGLDIGRLVPLPAPYGDWEDKPIASLTEDQRDALVPLRDAIKRQVDETFLLHGVTGSGKTEVYLRAIDRVIAAGQRAVVLGPEIARTELVIDRCAPVALAQVVQPVAHPQQPARSAGRDQRKVELGVGAFPGVGDTAGRAGQRVVHPHVTRTGIVLQREAERHDHGERHDDHGRGDDDDGGPDELAAVL